MSIQLCIVILYIILLFAISFYVKRRASQNPTEYLFAGRQFSTGLVAVSITGMAVGAASTVGVAESATKIGLAAGWYNAAWAIGAIIMGFVAAGKYRSLNCTTIPELFERSYDKKARIISGPVPDHDLHHVPAVRRRRFDFTRPHARYLLHARRHDHQCHRLRRHHGHRRPLVFRFI